VTISSLEKLQTSLTCEIAELIDWLSANKLSLHISETKYMLITKNMLIQIRLKQK